MTYNFGGWFGRYWVVAHALIQTKGNFARAATLLGIQRSALYQALRELR